jgi:hypothetical protein
MKDRCWTQKGLKLVMGNTEMYTPKLQVLLSSFALPSSFLGHPRRSFSSFSSGDTDPVGTWLSGAVRFSSFRLAPWRSICAVSLYAATHASQNTRALLRLDLRKCYKCV